MLDLVKGPAAHPMRRLMFALLFSAATAAGAAAQGPGGAHGPGGPGGHGPGFPGAGGGPGGNPNGGPGGAPTSGGNIPGSRGALQRGPAGRWWDNTGYAHNVGLTGDQQRRMDGVFAENRSALVGGLDNLRKAETRLSAVYATDHPSESAVNAEIQNVAQARADLEKASSHMVLEIRNEMTQEQLNKLDKLK